MVVLGVVLSIFVIYCIIVIAVRRMDKREGDAAHVLELREDASSARFVENMYSRAKKSLMEEHIWLFVFAKLPQKSTRVQRVSCCLSFLYLTMMASAMFYRESLVTDIPVNIGPLSLTTQEIFVSIAGALITYPINMVIVFLFRKTKLNSMSAANKRKNANQPHLNRRRKIRRRKRGPWAAVALPHFRFTAAWALCLLTSLASAVLVVLYSLEFGAETANRWMVAVVLSCIQDVLLFQPGFILFKKIACSCFQARRPLAQDDDSREISVSSPDPADTRAPPTPREPEESVQRQRKIKRLEHEMYSFLREVIIYLLFVTILIVYCYGQGDVSSAFNNVQEVKNLLQMESKVHVQTNCNSSLRRFSTVLQSSQTCYSFFNNLTLSSLGFFEHYQPRGGGGGDSAPPYRNFYDTNANQMKLCTIIY